MGGDGGDVMFRIVVGMTMPGWVWCFVHRLVDDDPNPYDTALFVPGAADGL